MKYVHTSDIAAWCNIDFWGDSSNPLQYAHHLFINGNEVIDLVIPDGVTKLKANIFKGCFGLTSVTIPNSVTLICNFVFDDCNNIQNIYCLAENIPSTFSHSFTGLDIKNITLYVPETAVAKYQSTAPWSSFGTIKALPKTYTLNVSSDGYATLFLDFNAEIPMGAETYVATMLKGDRLKMERVEGVLPANTAVIVKATEGTYLFTKSSGSPTRIEANLLRGSATDEYITAKSDTTYYVLSKVDGIVGMYKAKLTDGKFLNNANSAYIPLSMSVEQLSLKLLFDFGDETSIDETKGENGNAKPAVYDLSGRRVQNAQKGIYIQNGQMIIK